MFPSARCRRHLEPRPEPIYITYGPILCQLRVWSECEWSALPENRRPKIAELVPDLGWIGAVPVEVLN